MLFKKKRKTKEELSKLSLDSLAKAIQEKGIEPVKKLAQEHPYRMIFQKVKNPEEFQARSLALHYSMTGDYYKAIEHADKGLKINSESAYLFYIKGRSEGDIGLFAEGIKDLTEAIRLEPNYADAFVERGYIREKMGDVGVGGFWDDYDTALTIEPSIVLPHGYRRARGVRLLYAVKPQPKEEDIQKLRDAIIQSGYFKFFQSGDVYLLPLHPEEVGDPEWGIKITYPETRFLINPNDSQRFYEELFDKVFDLVKEFLNSRGYKLVGYYYDIPFTWWPNAPTKEAALIPIPELKLKEKKLD